MKIETQKLLPWAGSVNLLT